MKNLIFLTLICSCSFNSFSQTKQQSITELLRLTGDQLNKFFNSQTPVFPVNPAASPAEQARFADLMKLQMQTIQTLVQRLMDEDMAQIYDKHYTDAEIKDLVAFYKTPSGQKLISEGPAIQKDIRDIMATKYMPAMMEELKKHSEELKLKK